MINIELILGITGTVTGIISLFILGYKEIFKEKADLKIKSFTYGIDCYKEDYHTKIGRFSSNILFENKGNKDTSITFIFLHLGKLPIIPEELYMNNHSNDKKITLPIRIKANSSEEIRAYHFFENLEKYEKVRKTIAEDNRKSIDFWIEVTHTYGRIEKHQRI